MLKVNKNLVFVFKEWLCYRDLLVCVLHVSGGDPDLWPSDIRDYECSPRKWR